MFFLHKEACILLFVTLALCVSASAAGLQTVCTPKNTTWFNSSTSNFGPRVGIAWSPFSSHSGLFGSDRTVLRAGFGVYTGPGQTEDQLQPAESDRVWTTPSGGNSSLALLSAGGPLSNQYL